MSKRISLILVLIAIVLGVSYFHEIQVTEVRDEVRSGLAAPEQETSKSEIPL